MSNVAVIGPGAIGCVVTAALLDTGRHEVSIGARTAFDELVVETPDRAHRHRARVFTTPPGRTPADLVVLATKAHQTEGARGWLDAWCGPETVVVALQNGVEHHERLAPIIGEAVLAPGIVFLPASRSGPGRAALRGRAMITVPVGDAGARVAETFEGSFVRIRQTDDWLSDAWVKLLSNCAGGAISALTRRSNRVLEDAEAAALCRSLMLEAAAVGRAEGASLADDIADVVLEGILANAGDHASSIVVDRLAGLPTEWQIRNEVVVRKAAVHGIGVPLNRALTTLLRLGDPDA